MTARFYFRMLLSGHLLAAGIYCVSRVQDAAEIPPIPRNEALTEVRHAMHQWTVVIDPGHGGDDSGTEWNGLQEKTVALGIAKYVEKYLAADGVHVVMTRTEDVAVGLNERCALADDRSADLLVSIHLNACKETPDVAGLETYYFSHPKSSDHDRLRKQLRMTAEQTFRDERSLLLARSIQQYVTQKTHQEDRGVRDRDLKVLRDTPCPAVLVECGFLTNPSEAKFVGSDGYQEDAGKAIADAICHHLHASSLNPVRGIMMGAETGAVPTTPAVLRKGSGEKSKNEE